MDFIDGPIKTKAKMLKELRFEIWFWFRLQVKNKVRGLRDNKSNQLDPSEWTNLKHSYLEDDDDDYYYYYYYYYYWYSRSKVL